MKQLFIGLTDCVETVGSEGRAESHCSRRRKASMQDPAMPNSDREVALMSTSSLREPLWIRRASWLLNRSWEVQSSPVLTCLSRDTPSTRAA